MIKFTVRQISEITAGELFSKRPSEILTKSFSIDSRTISAGQFFIAVKGKNFDGHSFVKDAIARGASGFIVEDLVNTNLIEKGVHVIKVKDTMKAISELASGIRRSAEIPVICITGSNGKTTVKDTLSVILSSKYKVLANKRSFNNLIGLSLTLFEMDASYEALILELGTNSPGEILNLARIAEPDIGIITNVGNAHLEAFSSKEKIFEEKIELLKALSSRGALFFNKDDLLLPGLVSRQYKFLVRSYGKAKDSDFLISRISRKKNGFDFFLGRDKFFVPFPGLHNVYNAAAAIVSARYMGVKIGDIREVLKNAKLPEMRLTVERIGEVRFINDSYNASPESFECALDVLQKSYKNLLKGVVAGGMLELGSKTKEFHRRLGESIAHRGINFLVVLGDPAFDIACGAIEKGLPKEQVFYAKSYSDAAEKIRDLQKGQEKVVLLKGSRRTGMEEVLKCFTMFYTR